MIASGFLISCASVAVSRPNVVRIVFDLRTEVKPSVFPLAPVGEYKNRLVLEAAARAAGWGGTP